MTLLSTNTLAVRHTMGAEQSAFAPLTTRMEPERVPREIEPPTLMQSETAEQKFYRKVSKWLLLSLNEFS